MRIENLARVHLVIGSVMLALLAGEGALRLTGKLRPPPYPPRVEFPDRFQAYTPYGYRLVPSRHATYLYPRRNPRQLSLISNRDGFRGSRELEEPDPRPRVLFLGDSFVYGEGVEESERFTDVLERLQPSWRIDNLGMTGFGPDLMLRAFETVGSKLNPALAVLCLYTGDFSRVHPENTGVGLLIPRFDVQFGKLETIPYPKPSFWSHFMIYNSIRYLWWSEEKEWAVNEAILNRFEEDARRSGIRMALVFLPGRYDTRWDRKRRSWLRQFAARQGTPFLDLTAAIQGPGADQLFIPQNAHFNPAGHRLAAGQLQRLLSGQVLVPKY